MATVGVRCENNNSKRYDGYVWREPVECIVEHNGQVVTQPLDVADLKEGDQVKVRWGSKSRSKKLWNGVVTLSPPTSRKRKTRPAKVAAVTSKKVGECIFLCFLSGHKCER